MKFAIMYRPAGTGETWKAVNVIADTEESARRYVIDNYDVIGNENIASALFSSTTTEYQNDTTVETVTIGQNENIKVLDMLEGLDLGDYADNLNDYRGSSSYICDAISEIADCNTSIYYADIIDYIGNHVEDVADAIDEFGWNGCGNDLYKAGQLAEMTGIEHDIDDHLEDAVIMLAINVLAYDRHIDTIPADTWDELEERLHDIDNNNRFDDIDDIITDFFPEEGTDND